MKKNNSPVLIWSVDSNDFTLVPSKSSLRLLENRNVIPVAITSPNHEITHKKLSQYLKNIKINFSNLARVLVSNSYSRADYAKKLLIFALENNASAIALTSHGRKGLDRLIMGSFAESLLNLSPLPIIFLTDENFKPTKKAIFATDFSADSEIAFRNFLKFCQGYYQEIIIYHAGHSLVQSIAAYGAAGVPVMFPEEFLTDTEEDKKTLKEWEQKFSHQIEGIKISTMTQDTTKTVSKSILEACLKSEVEMIGVSSNLRPWERTFFGSVAQDIFRNGKIPVWIWGEFASEILSKSKKDAYEKNTSHRISHVQNLHK